MQVPKSYKGNPKCMQINNVEISNSLPLIKLRLLQYQRFHSQRSKFQILKVDFLQKQKVCHVVKGGSPGVVVWETAHVLEVVGLNPVAVYCIDMTFSLGYVVKNVLLV